MWTEARTWKYLAGRCDAAKLEGQQDSPSAYFTTFGNAHYGLCLAISDIHKRGRVSNMVCSIMHLRASRHRPPNAAALGFWWPRTLAGAKKRAAFCRKMANLAEKDAA